MEEESRGRMEGWLYRIHSNRLLRLSTRYFVLGRNNTLSCFKSLPFFIHEEPIKTGLIDSCICVKDNGRERILRRTLGRFSSFSFFTILPITISGKRGVRRKLLKGWIFSKKLHCRCGSKRSSIHEINSSDLLDWTGRFSPIDGHITADVIATSPWRFYGCKNGLRLFKEMTDGEHKNKWWNDHPALMVVGVVDATCESVFETIMSLGPSRSEWDFCFLRGKVVEKLDGHTDIIHKQFHSSWLSCEGMNPRDFLLHRYWRREDDGSYVILYNSVTHTKCPPCKGFVRACLKNGGYVISPFNHKAKPACAVVKHMLTVDWKFWQSYLRPSRARSITFSLLERIAAMGEMFKAKPEGYVCSDLSLSAHGNENSTILVDEKYLKTEMRCSTKHEQTIDAAVNPRSFLHLSDAVDEFFDVPEVMSGEFLAIDFDQPLKKDAATEGFSELECVSETQVGGHHKLSTASVFVRHLHELAIAAQNESRVDIDEERTDEDFLSYEGTLPKNSQCTLACSWTMADPSIFFIRGTNYLQDRQKIKGKHPIMNMVAADWIRSDRREDNLAGRPGSFVQKSFDYKLRQKDDMIYDVLCMQRKAAQGGEEFFLIINIQVPGSTTYSLVLYFMVDCPIEDFPLLDKFVEGDNAFRNSRFKLIPYISKGSWIVKKSVGKNACLIGQALEINYFHGKNYLELGIDIGSSSVAKGVVNLVLGYLSKLVIEMAFLIQADTEDELPEFILGTCRLNHLDVAKSVPAQQIYD